MIKGAHTSPVLSVQGQYTVYDAVVAQDGSWKFAKVTHAILAAPNYSSRRYSIKIRWGFYAENIIVEKEKSNIILVGDGTDKTIIWGNMSHNNGFRTYDTITVGKFAF